MSLRAVCVRTPEQAVIGGARNRCHCSDADRSLFGSVLRATCLRASKANQRVSDKDALPTYLVSSRQERQVERQVRRQVSGVRRKSWRIMSASEEGEVLVTSPETGQDLDSPEIDDGHRRWGEQKVHESSTLLGVKKRAFMLTNALRTWPLDVDLDAELGDAQINNERFDEIEVCRVMHFLAKTRANEILEEYAGLTQRENLPVADPQLDDVSDAHRALNLFSWWQRRNSKEPQDRLVLPLLTALAKANLHEEIRVFSEIFSAGFGAHSLVLSMLVKAYYNSGAYEAAISTYKQMRTDGLEVTAQASATALLSMGALDYPGEELLAVFREASWRGRFRPGALCYMLRAGISVEDIRAVAHDPSKPHLKVADLVLALCDLGRQVEAHSLADEVLESDLGFGVSSTVNLVAALERGGLRTEAQLLLEKSVARQMNIGNAVQQLMLRTRDARAAVRTYESIMRLEGWHHSHFFVHRDAIARFAQMNDADGAVRAYGEAMRIKTKQRSTVLQIGAQTYGVLIYTLAVAGRGAEAEAVLQDFYASRRERKETGNGNGNGNGTAQIATKQEMDSFKSAAGRLVGLYFGGNTPEKIVELVESMAAHRLWLSSNKVERWLALLKERNVDEELIKRYEAAMLKMKNMRLELSFKY